MAAKPVPATRSSLAHPLGRATRAAALATVAAALVTAGCSGPAGADRPPRALQRFDAMPRSPAWKNVDKLVGEQKFEEASRAVAAIRKDARATKNDAEVTRAIVKEVQLREALHGSETAVRFLRDEEWPATPVAHLTLDLFYAHALMGYLGMYSWEIGQREKVEAKGPVDLKAQTRDQIVLEAEKAYQEAWVRRAELSSAPLAQLAEYVDPNSYPAGIRDTLRDAVTYFAVELLSDSGNWTAEQSNEVYRLDLKELLGEGGPLQKEVRLDDAAVHPLRRAVAALDDLERWHAGAGQLEAAFEARLERLRRLHAAFTEARDRAQVRRDLEARLPRYRQVGWYAMGVARLARLVMDAGDRVAAHAIAEGGVAAYPKHPGGVRCSAILAELEAPDYQLAAMRSDGLGQRSIQITHRNLPAVYLRAYPVDLLARVTSLANDYNLLPAQEEMRSLARGHKPEVAWKVELPATPDYRSHRTFSTPPMKKGGLYVVLASAREDFGEAGNRIVGINMILGDLVLVARRDGSGEQQITAVAGSTGRPIADVELLLLRYDWQRKHSVTETHRTDAAGQYTFPAASAGARGRDGSYFLIARQGEDLALAGDNLYFSTGWEPGGVSSALVYTDRSIYRPQQTLSLKVVGYAGNPRTGDLKVTPGASMTVGLRDANGETVGEQQVKTNEYGTAAGTFAIPAGRLLGSWTVYTSAGGAAAVRVEEYKRPTFEVSIKDAASDLRLNKPATLTGEARYYFGLPVTTGQVRYRVTREPVYPWWWGYFYRAPRGGAAQAVATGSAEVRKDGTFQITFTPEADERQAQGGAAGGVSYRYQVSADFTDEGGETRSADKSFRLGFVAVEAALAIEGGAGFVMADDKAAITVRRTDLNGQGRAGAGSFRLVELAQPATTVMSADLPAGEGEPASEGDGDDDGGDASKALRTAGDRQRPRWLEADAADATLHRWKDGAERTHGDLQHDGDGQARLALPSLPPGAYRVRYQTVDPFGARYESFFDFKVAARGRPAALAVPVVLEAQRGAVKVGETARFLLGSGLRDQPLVLEIYRDGRLKERRSLDGRAPMLEIPIKAADRGGFGLVLWGVRDHQVLRATSAVMVPWDDKELKLEFSTFRDTLRPGTRETFRVTVKGPAGKVEARTAEVLAYMYDRSLDTFAPHQPPAPLDLYPSRMAIAYGRASLGQQSPLWVTSESLGRAVPYGEFSGDRLKFESGYGIGGLGMRGSGRGGGGFARGMPGAMPPPAPMAAAPASPARMREEVADAAKPMAKMAAPAEPRAQALAASTPAPAGEPVRSNFAETAFFQPQLLTDGQGQVQIEFQVPDSVTSWNVWVHAITRDLRAGSLRMESRSVKELMVRPYLPRFFREGDKIALKVVVNNASDHALGGKLRFELFDPDTQESLLGAFGVSEPERPFQVDKGGGANLTFPVVVPARVGPVALRVTARSGDFSDGELRPLPVLPGRMHLAQSRFVTLKDKDRRTMSFPDLAKGDDPSLINEQLVVTVDGQLFYTVLKALPYLIEYPYECTEQTMNRFVSTGVVSSVYRQYPAVAKMAAGLSKRTTRLETWDGADPNRKMGLEETPWLRESRGGPDVGLPLINALDPRIAAAQRDESLAKLQKMQTAIGGFPWFPGGPPSPFMTLYLMHGLAKATEFQVEVPREMVQRGWQYLAKHFREEYVARLKKKDWGWEFLTFLNYVASAYPDASWTGGALSDDERKEILAFSFAHWKEHSPYLKALLALTLQRMGRPADAKLVFDSIMDSAKTEQDKGTFWAQEDRSWLWYNDTTETHAFALRAMMEIRPDDPRKDGLVLWLLLDKKLNHWKSTRATAEVIYSLVKYLDKAGQLGVREEIKVSAPPLAQTFVLDPDQYVGKSQLVIPGDRIDGKTSSTITVEKETKGFAFASATWHFSTEKLPAEARGDFFAVSRRYFKRDGTGKEVKLVPLADGAALQAGDEVEVQVSLQSKHQAEYVHLRDPRPAGFEPVTQISGYKWDLGIGWYEEVRDSGENFFFEWLPVGEYAFKYRIRAALAGTFRVAPATVQAMYAPEFVAYSAGDVVTVK